MSRLLFAVTFAGLTLAACSPAPTTQAPLPPLTESLTLTGPVSGQMTQADAACAVDTKGQVTQPLTVTLDGTISGKTMHIVLRVDAYLGAAGSYVGENFAGLIDGFSVTPGPAPSTNLPMLKASSGTITVGKGGTGSVDMTSGTQTIKGNWHCR